VLAIWHQKFTGLQERAGLGRYRFLEDSLWKSRCEDRLTPYKVVRWTYFSAIAAEAMRPFPLYWGTGRGTSIRFRLLWGAAHLFSLFEVCRSRIPIPPKNMGYY